MTREEALAQGINLCDTKHSMKRRGVWHNYHHQGIYMVTLAVEGRVPLLGRLVADETNKAPDEVRAYVQLSRLGEIILKEEVQKISRFYPMVEVWRICIMPDHIHMIIRVKDNMPPGKTLGNVVRGFKTGCSRAWWKLMPDPWGKAQGTEAHSQRTGGATQGTKAATQGTKGATQGAGGAMQGAEGNAQAPVSSAFPEDHRPVLFEAGYNDKILLHEGQLANWKAYLDDNPRRLLIKRMYPDFFTVRHDIEIAGRKCQMIGNRFLLDVPDKMAVIVHRRYTDEEIARLQKEWLACGERGGVLVSAAIAPKEKDILRKALNLGYSIILLRENGFPELYKPTGESFNACSMGQLLQISPWNYHMDRKKITREQCLELNMMAETICR